MVMQQVTIIKHMNSNFNIRLGIKLLHILKIT